MLTTTPPTRFFAGVDNIFFDRRSFEPTREDIEHICRFFSLGKLRHYQKESGIAISHSNFIIFVTTTAGKYVLKYYPAGAAKAVVIEYAANRLIAPRLPTPAMYAGHAGQPFLASHDRLVTCFDCVDGQQAWHYIQQKKTIHQINSIIFSLKTILSGSQDIPFLKQESLLTTLHSLSQESRLLAPYTQKKLVDALLIDASKIYQKHRPLFKRQWLHNNTTLTNFLVDKKTVYLLDLSHLRQDYFISDLTSLLISCLFLKIPEETMNRIVKDYFRQHNLKHEHTLVLKTLIQVGLIKEFLKNAHREKCPDPSSHPAHIRRAYKFHLSKRKKSIIEALKYALPGNR